MSDPEAAETNGHRPPVPGHASKVDDHVRLENKPILEWSRDDWQLWAAGLNESKGEPVADAPVQPEPVDLQDPVQPEPVDLQDPVQPRTFEEQPEPVRPQKAGDEPDTPAMETAPTETVFATASLPPEPETRDVPVEVHETPSSVPSESSPSALQLSPSLSATRAWPAQLQEAAVQTARTRARSALGLLVIAVVVGALVAGLVTFVIMVTSLVLRRALGS